MERSDVIRPAYRTASVPVKGDHATIAADPFIVLMLLLLYKGSSFYFQKCTWQRQLGKSLVSPKLSPRVRFAAEHRDEWN